MTGGISLYFREAKRKERKLVQNIELDPMERKKRMTLQFYKNQAIFLKVTKRAYFCASLFGLRLVIFGLIF